MNKLAETIETYINGNITIAKKEMFNKVLNGFDVIECTELFGVKQTIKVLKSLGVKDLHIINSFHDYDRDNLDDAKEILLTLSYSNVFY
jgi:hypothetical protein|tara:strand:+ start:55 stop:321 length:267 start_codon:yes stop_codon:yes gene_type:complete